MKNDKNQNNGLLHQIVIEIKKMLSSKFMLILMILILVFSIAVPVISAIQLKRQNQNNGIGIINTLVYGGRYYGSPDSGMDELIIDGQVIASDNPQYWEIRDLNEQIERLTANASTPADDLTLAFLKILLDSNLKVAKTITSYEDYRQSLAWRRTQIVMEKFIFENLDKPKDDLIQAIQYRKGIDTESMEEQYYSLSQVEVLEELDKIDAKLAVIDKIIVEDDYIEYYRFEMQNLNEQHEQNLDEIARLEEDITEEPQYEEMYDSQIENMKRSNKIIIEISIPAYQYRIDNDIIIRSDDWRDLAVSDKQNTQSNLIYSEILTQEQFEEDEYLKREFKTYRAYTENRQKEIDDLTKKLLIAEKSLETGKPDMKYVPNGPRKKVVYFLWYSMIIAVFGVIIGGGLIAKEYQAGTIRLLLIRPKTRVKIVLSKLLSLLAVCFALYAASALLNIVMNGMMFGFGDFSFPNYTISSGANGIGFLGYYITKFFACFITILFACSTAFFMSATTKNTALSVAIPLVAFVGSLMAVAYVGSNSTFAWLAYTPIPYVNFSLYFISDVTNRTFQPMLGFGISLMIFLSLAFIAIGTLVSKKRDITN